MNEDHHLGEDLALVAEGGGTPELREHAGGCAACQAAIVSTQMIYAAVAKIAPPDPSASFDAAMRGRLDAIDALESVRGPQTLSLFERLGELFTLPRLGFAVAGVALVLISVMFFFEEGRREPEQLLTAELVENIDELAFVEDFELYESLEIVEDLDVIEDLGDLEALEALENGEPG
jgi:hypothetical protein